MALAQERDLRIADLQGKNALRAQLRVLNALVIHQPKLQLHAEATDQSIRSPGAPASLSLVWDPLTELLEAVSCPTCGRPTFELKSRRGAPGCPACVAGTPTLHHPLTR